MFLLDVNVLIALFDRNHSFRIPTKEWFVKNKRSGWATCPLTENGFLRIVSNYRYVGGSINAEDAREWLGSVTNDPHYLFLPDEISFRNTELFPAMKDFSSRLLTDIYLLALAGKNGGKLITHDSSLGRQKIGNLRSNLEILAV